MLSKAGRVTNCKIVGIGAICFKSSEISYIYRLQNLVNAIISIFLHLLIFLMLFVDILFHSFLERTNKRFSFLGAGVAVFSVRALKDQTVRMMKLKGN